MEHGFISLMKFKSGPYCLCWSPLSWMHLFSLYNPLCNMWYVQNPPEVKETFSVANNACWAIGELAVKVGFSLWIVIQQTRPKCLLLLSIFLTCIKILVEENYRTSWNWACMGVHNKNFQGQTETGLDVAITVAIHLWHNLFQAILPQVLKYAKIPRNCQTAKSSLSSCIDGRIVFIPMLLFKKKLNYESDFWN